MVKTRAEHVGAEKNAWKSWRRTEGGQMDLAKVEMYRASRITQSKDNRIKGCSTLYKRK